ncbi:MAG: hypothetical protein AAF682_30415 [Planctomycetota bacterium]
MPRADVPRRCEECDDVTPHNETWLAALSRLVCDHERGWLCQRCEWKRRRPRAAVWFAMGYVWERRSSTGRRRSSPGQRLH